MSNKGQNPDGINPALAHETSPLHAALTVSYRY